VALAVPLGMTVLQSNTKNNWDASLQRALAKYQDKLCFSAIFVLLQETVLSIAVKLVLRTTTSLLAS